MAAQHPLLADVRGRGLVQGIELRDPAGGERFPASDNVTGRLAAAARERGLLIYACPTPVGNQHMDAVLLAPPLIIDDGEIDELLEKLGDAVAEVERDL
jgi:adenosylmethionine-8-amino-7-oxononanoate aminotransferase